MAVVGVIASGLKGERRAIFVWRMAALKRMGTASLVQLVMAVVGAIAGGSKGVGMVKNGSNKKEMSMLLDCGWT